jgi:hypothetical protein
VRERAGGHGVRGVLAVLGFADGVHCVGVRSAAAAATLMLVAGVGVVAACGAGFRGDGVEAAFEEVPVGAGEGEVLRCGYLLVWLFDSGR